ncbi:MAG: hypothetical protein LUH48_03275 [Clostridiales bacterium]|nr:hypothetical protein [Clostridiales bacterium]
MEINVRDDKKLVDVWLTNAEKNDPQIQAQLKKLYAKYKEKKYLVAVYQSGSRDLYESTLALLAYNKKRVAELDVQREKRQRAATVER